MLFKDIYLNTMLEWQQTQECHFKVQAVYVYLNLYGGQRVHKTRIKTENKFKQNVKQIFFL